MLRILIMIFALSQFLPLTVFAGVKHELIVELYPDKAEIQVTDRITFDTEDDLKTRQFQLNAGLNILSSEPSITLLSQQGTTNTYKLTNSTANRLTLHYRGTIVAPEYTGMDGMPSAIISSKGVYLDSGADWYANFKQMPNMLIEHFTMETNLPAGWESISQGKRWKQNNKIRWESEQPQQEIYLLASPFHRYARQHKEVDLSVYLLKNDEHLANHYLSVLGTYIDRYSKLLGPYPFAKFAVVENVWQTGYGMPSFTLLGSKVMRLPFIPYTSLPHEVLHNWLGNSIWIDYRRGNWSEGLTAYLSDHLMKELKGNDAEYRRQALERFTDFTSEHKDFPLQEFLSRHDDASQAVGYSKSLMLFHMIRQQLGDERFRLGLQQLWKQGQFRHMDFHAVLASFALSREQLLQIRQWLTETGAPELKLDHVSVTQTPDGYKLGFTLRQLQDEPYRLTLPLAITLEGHQLAEWHSIQIDATETEVTMMLNQKPQRVDLDPAFDVMRMIGDSERPATFSQLFGSENAVLILPSENEKNWEPLVRIWKQRYPKLKIQSDREIGTLPLDKDIWIAGWDNRLINVRQDLFSEWIEQTDKEVFSLVVTSMKTTGHSVGFIGATGNSIPALAGKLPHYGKFSYLLFDQQTGKNVLKQTHVIDQSALSKQLTSEPSPLQLPPRAMLVD